MSTSIKNMLVGIFVLSSITLLVFIIMFLKPTIGDGKQTLHVRFSNINSLGVGTRVLFAGRPVGEVVGMEEIKDAREQPTDELGRVYFYQLTLHIDSSVKVYNTDEISIQTSGLMGERSIGITPKSPPKGVEPKRISTQPIYADSVDTFQNALLDFSDLSTQMEDTFKQASNWIKAHGEEVADTIRVAGTAIQQMEDEHAFTNIAAVIENIKTASADVAKGKGTLGKIVAGDDLYLQFNAVMTKANTLMNDLNSYGILFHLNKQWQRTRLQKVSELNALATPQEFRRYFQDEVEDINSAMTRISMLIDKADNSPQKEQILHTEGFKKDFSELMRRADELSDNLRLYNEQFNQAAGN
ncbi:MAG: MlaD family protein [Simkaniaceae bacterium]|nr:MlaD family protein [Candidatus Sacchlamyda saccharinae]